MSHPTSYGVRLARLPEEPEPEAEHLVVVRRLPGEREAEVEGDWHRAEHRHDEADAEAGRHAVVVDLVDARLDGAAVHEADDVDLVVGQHGNLILEAVEEHEVAADLEAVDLRRHAAELEAADAAEAAGKVALVDGSVVARPRDLTV